MPDAEMRRVRLPRSPASSWATRSHPIAGCLASVGCLIALVVLAYYAPPAERLDAGILSELNAPGDSLVSHLAFDVQQPVSPLYQVVAVVLACLLAVGLGRPRRALFAVALVAGTAAIVQILKIVLAHSRYHPIPVHHQTGLAVFPVATSFPSGNSAGALSIALAFLFVVPASWRRLTGALGIGFTVLVSLGLLVLNYHYPSDVLGGLLVAVGWGFALSAAWISTPIFRLTQSRICAAGDVVPRLVGSRQRR